MVNKAAPILTVPEALMPMLAVGEVMRGVCRLEMVPVVMLAVVKAASLEKRRS